MTLLVAAIVGFLASRLVWTLVRPVFSHVLFQRENFRGRLVPSGAGLVLVLAVIVVEAGRIVAGAVVGDDDSWLSPHRLAVLVLAAALGFLGFVDDLVGTGERRGFRGHLQALGEGRLTTGGLKLFGGAGVAVLAAAVVRPAAGLGYLLLDGVLIALAANLGNLLDLAPGRALKGSALAFAGLAAATAADVRLAPIAIVTGAALALLRDDLHERLMLGDTGANLLGGVLGLGVVIIGTPTVRLAVLGAVAVLNGVSEWVSFSRVIDAVPPLRALDRAGRRS